MMEPVAPLSHNQPGETERPAAPETMAGRLHLGSELRRALDRDQFVVHYQPIVPLNPGRPMGVEALVRWLHPEVGVIPPAEFIPAAEATGTIVALGQWVLDRACHQTRRWQELYSRQRPLSVAVNLSPGQLRPGLVESVAQTLQESQLDPRCLTLEITESFLGEEASRVEAYLGELKALGVRLALDDFGTAYSSLDRLRRFPVDEVKIDRSFIADIGPGRDGAPLVSAVIAMAHTLDLEVVAEGVERPDQLEFLLRHGCDSAQGWLFSRPVAPGGMQELLVGPFRGRRKARPERVRADQAFSVTTSR